MASVLAATTIPFSPIEVPPAAIACQEWAGVPGTQVAALIPAVGTTQLTSATSVETPPTLCMYGWTSAALSSGGRVFPQSRSDRLGEDPLLVVVDHAPDPFQSRSDRLGEDPLLVVVDHAPDPFQVLLRPALQALVGQHGEEPVHDFVLHARSRAQGSAFGRASDPLEDRLCRLRVRVPHVVERLGKVGNHVGRVAPAVIT